jgi:hypothetical protein
MRMGATKPVDREIVGIAEDIRISGLYEPAEMYVYVPYAQDQQGFGLLLVEAETDVAALIAPVKQQIAQVDANVPVLIVSSFAERSPEHCRSHHDSRRCRDRSQLRSRVARFTARPFGGAARRIDKPRR